MKTVYFFNNFIKVQKFTAKHRKIKIKNFHKIKIKDAVMIICIKNNKILLLKEFRFGLNQYTWGLPGGFIDDNEKPLFAAKRELLEEIGIKISKLKKLYSYVRNGNYHCGVDHVFLANLNKIEDNLKFEKNVKAKWSKISLINKFLKKGEFKTSGVIASLLFFLFKYKNNFNRI